MIPMIAVVGRTNSGKTTLIEQLIPALARRGYRVATIKHPHHGDFEADHPGKDSWRHAQVGAVATALAGTRRLAVFQRVETEVSPEQIASLFVVRPDLVLTEDYKDSLCPKVEVVRRAQGVEPLCGKEDQLIALVTDGAWDLGVPRFGLDDPAGIDFTRSSWSP
jgi:molybdopterin-guanine dinucleotide biosynthesis protein MobB